MDVAGKVQIYCFGRDWKGILAALSGLFEVFSASPRLRGENSNSYLR